LTIDYQQLTALHSDDAVATVDVHTSPVTPLPRSCTVQCGAGNFVGAAAPARTRFVMMQHLLEPGNADRR
jgi:hypothetical protein